MKTKLMSLILGLSILFLSEGAHAEEKLKEKSAGFATALGLDPIPGDALFYAGKNAQGTINLVIGAVSAAGLAVGISELSCDNQRGNDSCKIEALVITLASGIPYFAMLVWDAAGGISGVKAHNERVHKQQSWLQTLQPTFAVSDKGTFVGAKFNF